MKMLRFIVMTLALNGLIIASHGQTNDSLVGSPPSGVIGKVELVWETKLGSGNYEVLSDVPLFPAFSGVGHGPPDLSKAKYIDLSFTPDLETTKVGVIRSVISGPGGQFDGNLTETAANSGIFTDDKHTVNLTLPVGTTTADKKDNELFTVDVTSDSLGLHHAKFTLYFWRMRGTDLSGHLLGDTLISPVTTAEIQFPTPYNPSTVNHLRATLKLFYDDPETGATGGGFNPLAPSQAECISYTKPTDFTETAAGSLTFFDSISKSKIHLTDFTGTDPSRLNRMDAAFSPGWGDSANYLLTLTETSLKSMDFSIDATMGGNENSGNTDEPTDNPEVTGDGVFRIRIKGAKGPVILIVQSDINKIFVTATPIAGDPTTLLSGKLILVPKNADTNTNYKTIQTLYTAGNAPGSTPGVSIYRADISGAQLDPKDAEGYNDLAWLLATCPEARLRDGRHAVQAATKACELSRWKDPNFIDTLAAAYAEAGDFDSAVKWENYSLTLPNLTADESADGKSHLALFQAHKPYHRDQ